MSFKVEIKNQSGELITDRVKERPSDAVDVIANAITHYKGKNESVNIRLLDSRGYLILSVNEKYLDTVSTPFES